MTYGICKLSLIPIRKNPSDKSEMINQLLFGEHFKIIKKDSKWSHIKLAHDSYEGWICNKQWIEINEETYLRLEKEVPTITMDLIDIIKKDESIPIIIGSILPSFKSGYANINDELYQFDGLTTHGFSKKEELIKNAFIYLNAPYLWGGRTPFGIDCSGFTQMIYRLQGISIPRDAYQQVNIGKEVIFNDAQTGDLAFFENNEKKITHVGIILNHKNIIHASGKVRVDSFNEKGIFNKELNKYTHTLNIIKTIN